jgi:hypothetical protein
MTASLRFDPVKLGLRPAATPALRPFERAVPAPVLIRPVREASAPAPRRSKIWELASNLHCSIIGTCLSTAELRQILAKAKLAPPGATDHDLHGRGVTLAGRHDGAAKLLNKALDQRHRLAIRQFETATTDDEIRAAWRAAVQRGEIPGAYWAALSHPAISNTLARDIFGDVHMLSHLVGAANRADIRRLAELERDKAALEDKIARQQAQLRDAIVARDQQIDELGRVLAKLLTQAPAVEDGPAADENAAAENATLAKLAADLERRLDGETRRRERAEGRLLAVEAALTTERGRRAAAEAQEHVLRDELDGVEASLAVQSAGGAPSDAAIDLGGRTLLYVGGRPSQLAHLRALGERLGAQFLHHDGGVDERSGLLAGLVSRADLVLFPVDCVSHEAALVVKRLCRQAEKPFLPLRSAGLGSFLAALSRAKTNHASA